MHFLSDIKFSLLTTLSLVDRHFKTLKSTYGSFLPTTPASRTLEKRAASIKLRDLRPLPRPVGSPHTAKSQTYSSFVCT
jgi:hypothetical protein